MFSPNRQSPVANPLLVTFFDTSAYQVMLRGEDGAHHCRAPEAPKLIIEERGGPSTGSGQAALVTCVIGEQTWSMCSPSWAIDGWVVDHIPPKNPLVRV